jgi:cytochrome c
MRRIGPAFAFLAASAPLLALGACAGGMGGEGDMGAAAPAPVSHVEEGRQLASRLCVTCHAVGDEGASRNPNAPPLRTLAERYPGTLLEDAFPQRMEVGHPAMPEYNLNDDQVQALLDYLLSIQERQGA